MSYRHPAIEISQIKRPLDNVDNATIQSEAARAKRRALLPVEIPSISNDANDDDDGQDMTSDTLECTPTSFNAVSSVLSASSSPWRTTSSVMTQAGSVSGDSQEERPGGRDTCFGMVRSNSRFSLTHD